MEAKSPTPQRLVSDRIKAHAQVLWYLSVANRICGTWLGMNLVGVEVTRFMVIDKQHRVIAVEDGRGTGDAVELSLAEFFSTITPLHTLGTFNDGAVDISNTALDALLQTVILSVNLLRDLPIDDLLPLSPPASTSGVMMQLARLALSGGSGNGGDPGKGDGDGNDDEDGNDNGGKGNDDNHLANERKRDHDDSQSDQSNKRPRHDVKDADEIFPHDSISDYSSWLGSETDRAQVSADQWIGLVSRMGIRIMVVSGATMSRLIQEQRATVEERLGARVNKGVEHGLLGSSPPFDLKTPPDEKVDQNRGASSDIKPVAIIPPFSPNNVEI
jgi:hypothetical protein